MTMYTVNHLDLQKGLNKMNESTKKAFPHFVLADKERQLEALI